MMPALKSLERLFRSTLICALILGLIQTSRGEVLIQPGDSVAFLGDSITRQGFGPDGWCRLVVSSLDGMGIKVDPINAGRGGHTSRDMVGRFEADVLEKKPTWMILMCGTNDNPNHGLSLEESERNITTIIEKTQAAGINVLMATRPMRGGDTNENAYNAFIHALANRKGIPLADVFLAMKETQHEYLNENPTLPPKTAYLTVKDGTHMNARGNQVIAECVLAALGVGPEQIYTAKKSWPDLSTDAKGDG